MSTAAPKKDGPKFTAFVKNIPYQSGPKDLYVALQGFGKINTTRIISQKFRGQNISRGFGFVDFDTQESLDNAVKATGTVKIGERPLYIRVALPPKQRDTLFIRGIPQNTKEEEIKAVFAQWNPKAVLIKQFNRQDKLGFAFVQFDTQENQTEACKANRQITLQGAQSTVSFAKANLNQNRRPFRPRYNKVRRA